VRVLLGVVCGVRQGVDPRRSPLQAPTKAWILGAVLCKVLLYGQIVTLACTTFILTSMSLDRYLAICHPLGSFAVSRSRPRVMITVSWLLAFLFASPQLAIFKQVPLITDVKNVFYVFYSCHVFTFFKVFFLFSVRFLNKKR